jgi:hypothetical protein
MRRRASDRLILAAVAMLAVTSLGLKAAAGPPRDGLMNVGAERLNMQLAAILRSQHFAIAEQRFRYRSTLILATRGACRLGVRDARDGAAMATAFGGDAAMIGTVRYLYRGRSYDQPPGFAMRLGRIETEALDRLGMSTQAPMPVAIAASPACGSRVFGLEDLRI